MTKENWEEFSKEINRTLTPILKDKQIFDTKELNRYWNIWSSNIIRIANQRIPTTHTAPKPFYALSLKASKLHSALKHINKCLHTLTTISPPLSIEYYIPILNKHLKKAASLIKTPSPSIDYKSIRSEKIHNTQMTYYNHTLKILK